MDTITYKGVSQRVKPDEVNKDTPWENIPENIKEWFGHKRIELEAAHGKEYPAEFLYELADIALETVFQWGKDNNIPQDILSLIGSGHVLKNYCVWEAKKEMKQAAYSDIPDNVETIVSCTTRLGKTILREM